MKRILLAQIGSNNEIVYLAPDVWVFHARRLTVPPHEQAASFWTTVFNASWEGVNIEPIVDISNVYRGIYLFSKVASYEELAAVGNSFFWDEPAQVLYVRVYNDTPEFALPSPYSYGLTVGMIDSSDIDEDGLISSTIGGIAYHPALISSGLSASLGIDDLANNKMTFDKFIITANNAGGIFDASRAEFFQQRADLFLAMAPDNRPVTAGDFTLIRTGVIREVSFTSDVSMRLEAVDPRSGWDQVAPFDVFTTGDFEAPTGNRALSYIGKPKPLALGELIKVPTVPLSADGDTTNTRHLVSSVAFGGLVSISGVWEIVDDQEVARTYTVDLPSGVVTVTAAGYEGGQIVVSGRGLSVDRTVYVDSEPAPNLDNTPQQLAYWLAVNLGAIPNTGSYFDRDSFRAAERSYTDSSIYIPVGGEKLTEVLDRVTVSAGWLMYAEEGKFKAARLAVIPPEAVDRLYTDELESPPDIDWQGELYASRVQFDYRPSVYNERFLSLFENSKEADLIKRYKMVQLKTIQTPLNIKVAADAELAAIYERVSFVPAVLRCQLSGPTRWKLADFVSFDYIMDGRRRLPDQVFRVVEIDPVGQQVTLRQYTDTEDMRGSVINTAYQMAKGV